MRYDKDRETFVLSVRRLCEIALCGGDIDLRFAQVSPFEAMALGAKLHQKVQGMRPPQYRAEVPLCNTTLCGDIYYEVSGRADGIFEGKNLIVEEIKSVSPKAFSHPPQQIHWAQLKCYAYFLCKERALSEISMRLTYISSESEKERSFDITCTALEVQEYYISLLQKIAYRAEIAKERAEVLLPSAAMSHFPYGGLREGQELLVKECYRDIKAGKRLFAEAPTGIGKTVSTLYPAVRALGEGHIDKIFYLTAKSSTRREAFRAASDIFSAGAHLRTVVLAAREQMCLCDGAKADPAGISRHCNPVDCPYAKGYYDKEAHALCHALSKQNGFTARSVKSIASEFGICPYEFELFLSEFCDIVICDYNYTYDPQVYLRRYFEGGPQGRYVFLVDEAHNLGDRASAMYSTALQNTELQAAAELLPEGEKLFTTLQKVIESMQKFRVLCKDSLMTDESGTEHGYYLSNSPLSSFADAVVKLRPLIDAWMRENREHPAAGVIYRLSAAVKKFELIGNYYDQHFLTFIEIEGAVQRIHLICLDPSEILEVCNARALSSVFFSATLTPPDYFADILGGGKGSVRISLPSPFAKENLCVAAMAGISTRYEDRAASCKKVAAALAAMVSAQSGNYIAYFPSYQYMEEVQKAFLQKYPKVQTVMQSRNMGMEEKEAFLDQFRADGQLRLGFCVLGGSFSEGIDLPGLRLIGTAIIGTGLPGISNSRNILKEYYDNTRERGFDYAYVYPGMNRVLQAAGRVIRREDDRGVIVLIDDRYLREDIKYLLPEHWQPVEYLRTPMELSAKLHEFWKKT